MSLTGLSLRLENASDWLSPIVVKEVRQTVRGREFSYSFGASLVAGLTVAFFGAAEALTGTGTAGSWTFGALMTCLTLVALAVVPLGAFSALRIERMEQTLELITLTALTPRRVVVGKLLAQAVKLGTLFAAVAPFIAMSFLLGGVDFTTILVALAVLFVWSMWTSAACLFLSVLFRSRAMIGLVIAGAGLVLILVLGLTRVVYFAASRGVYFSGTVYGVGFSGSHPWWALAIMTTFCLASMVNLVLLAESRLRLPSENRVTPLRVGFLVQFLLLAGWTLSFITAPPAARLSALQVLGVVGGLHLAVVAMFTVTEDLVPPRRVLLRSMRASRWSLLLAMFRPGGGRGALYVLAQMALLLGVAWALQPTWIQVRWLIAICGYICLFSGVPTLAIQSFGPEPGVSFRLRVALLTLLALAMVSPDIVHYVFLRPDTLDLTYSARHLVNPIRTLANWPLVETHGWASIPFAMGLVGLLAYLLLIRLGMKITAEAAEEDRQKAAAGEPGSANAFH